MTPFVSSRETSRPRLKHRTRGFTITQAFIIIASVMPEEQVLGNPEEVFHDERFRDLIEAGVFYGRKRTKTHPRMRPYIVTTRNDMEIIDLERTLEGLEKALGFLKERIVNGARFGEGQNSIFIVGTQPQVSESALKLAKEFNLPWVTVRWLGGLMTNFKVLSKRIEYYKKLKSELKSGALEKYTKKERLGFEKEIKRLEELFGGLENYTVLPEALIVIDPTPHMTAVREAKRLKIPVIAYVNTDTDPDSIDYPVIGNTKSRKSVDWFLGKIAEAFREAKSSIQNLPREDTDKTEGKEQA